MRKRAKKRQEKKRKSSRLILKRLCAAFLRSFRGQHGEKTGLYEDSARGNWIPREFQQPFQPKRGRGPHHHVEAAVDWCRLHYIEFKIKSCF